MKFLPGLKCLTFLPQIHTKLIQSDVFVILSTIKQSHQHYTWLDKNLQGNCNEQFYFSDVLMTIQVKVIKTGMDKQGSTEVVSMQSLKVFAPALFRKKIQVLMFLSCQWTHYLSSLKTRKTFLKSSIYMSNTRI